MASLFTLSHIKSNIDCHYCYAGFIIHLKNLINWRKHKVNGCKYGLAMI